MSIPFTFYFRIDDNDEENLAISRRFPFFCAFDPQDVFLRPALDVKIPLFQRQPEKIQIFLR